MHNIVYADIHVYLLLHLTQQVHHGHSSFSISVSNSESATGARHHQLVRHITICQKTLSNRNPNWSTHAEKVAYQSRHCSAPLPSHPQPSGVWASVWLWPKTTMILVSNILLTVSNTSRCVCVCDQYLEESSNSRRSAFISVHSSHDSTGLDVSSTGVVRNALKQHTTFTWTGIQDQIQWKTEILPCQPPWESVEWVLLHSTAVWSLWPDDAAQLKKKHQLNDTLQNTITHEIQGRSLWK